jgi:hypothetical protein
MQRQTRDTAERPGARDEHLLRDSESLFTFGGCRLCGGTFRSEQHEDHLDYHGALFTEYTPQRAKLDRRVREQEENLGARLVCETSGMPTVTEKQLTRHEQIYGSEGVDELLPYLGLSRARPKRRRYEKRIAEVHRLHKEHKTPEEIVLLTGLSHWRMKRYLSLPENGLTKPSETRPTQLNGSDPTETLPAVWNTPRKRSSRAGLLRRPRSSARATSTAAPGPNAAAASVPTAAKHATRLRSLTLECG